MSYDFTSMNCRLTAPIVGVPTTKGDGARPKRPKRPFQMTIYEKGSKGSVGSGL
jgi:hypothetical protein